MTESKNWRPSRWSEEAVRRRVKRVYRVAQEQMAYIVGPYLGNLIFAELITNMKSEQSRCELNRRGYKTIGDMEKGA